MELTQEHLRHVEAIKSEMNCPKGFECQKAGFSDYPSVRHVGKLLECLQKDAKDCRFAVPFGIGYLCRCPLNRYIHNLGGRKAVY